MIGVVDDLPVLDSGQTPRERADAAFALNGALLDPAAGERLGELMSALVREVSAPVESA